MPKFKVTLEVSTYVSAEVEADSAEEAEEKLSQSIEVIKDNFEEDYDIRDFERDGIITRLYEVYEEELEQNGQLEGVNLVHAPCPHLEEEIV